MRLRVVLQEQEEQPGRLGLKASAESQCCFKGQSARAQGRCQGVGMRFDCHAPVVGMRFDRHAPEKGILLKYLATI